MRLPGLTAVTAVFLLSIAPSLFPQSFNPVSGRPAGNGVWADVSEQQIAAQSNAGRGTPGRHRDIVPRKYRTLRIDKASLRNALALAVPEGAGPIEITGIEFHIPHPRGGFHRFLIQESPIMEPKLAARFPELKTYVGRSLDDPTATVRIDVTPRGFHAVVLSAEGQIYIDPYARDTDVDYISYFKQDLVSQKPFSCAVETDAARTAALAAPATAQRATGGTLKTYRLALACTGEYAAAVCSPNGPTVSATLAAIITSVNRCDAIYERELAIRFVLVDNTDKLIYLDGNTDPFTNNSGSLMLSQNQSTIDSVIGTGNYDFGHVFSTGGGGIASLGVVCVAGFKARGVTGLSSPVGDPYDVDYVVHEMGHQFGANHPFDGTSGSCSGNGYAPSAYEPGSGSTIMAYAGICSGQNLASHSDDYFDTISYDEIINYISGGSGSGCAQQTSTGNTPPAINALSAFTIPAQTPFSLTASATDPDGGDTLTYCWEEFDRGAFQDPTADPRDNGSSPLFRSFPPTTNPTRTFPSLTYILNNQNVPPPLVGGYATGEFLPTTSRAMTFRITMRDNHPGGGGTAYDSTTVTSVSSAGPFAITAPNTSATIAAGTPQTILWNIANTDIPPINCANVKISLSTDGGNTFPIVLASSMPNIGAATVTIPNTANVATTQGRIKVEAVGNVFFDISDANLTITSTNTAPVLTISNAITVARGKPVPTVATIGSASDANGNSLSVAVSDLPFGAHITPSILNGTISLSATVDCRVVTGPSSRTYPITVTVTDSNGSTASAKASLIVTPNPSPTLGAYADITVAPNSTASSGPTPAAADSNGNLGAAPFSVLPTNLPGGGTLTVNQSTGMVTATTTSGTTTGAVAVRVSLLDSCGAAAVQTFNVNVVTPSIPSLQAGTESAPTSEGCSPANGAVDPGETVTVNLPIINNGSSTTNLVGTLQASGGVSPVTTTQTYGAIGNNSSVSRAFQFAATGNCGDTITATLQLQDGATNYGVVTYTMPLGSQVTAVSQNFDGVTAPALPSGWTAVVASGSASPWATNNNAPDSAPNSVSATTVTTVSDNQLVSPAMNIPSKSAQLNFRHRWNHEDGYDGGVLEISINGGAYADIVAAGGSFVSGSYNGTISANYSSPIGGRPAWTGAMDNSYTSTSIDLPATAFGKSAKFRWRLASDDGTSVTGAVWRIDNITLTGYSCSACPSAPAITNGPPPATVVVSSPYNFAFNSTGNPAPSFSLKSGTLPPGLSLSSSGVLSGMVNSGGGSTYSSIVVSADNGNPPAAQTSFNLTTVTRAASYLGSYGLTGSNADLVYDYDRDGIANLVEYALGLNPAVANISGLPVVSIKKYGPTYYLSITFHRSSAATDLTYTVQVSGDLATWTDLASSVGGAQTSGSGFVSETGSAPNLTVEVRDTVPYVSTNAGKRFLRLKITSP